MSISDDIFLDGALHLLQPEKGYRAGVDAVYLGAAVPVRSGVEQCVLDVGAGVGTAGLCVAQRCPDVRVVLVERETMLAELAQKNISRNGLGGRVTAVAADVGRVTTAELRAAGLGPQSFDHVIANPPYHVEGAGTAAGNELKAAAHAMPSGGLEIWCRFIARMTKPGGTATIIHKACALPHVLAGLARRFGGLKVLPIHARAREPAIRVLVQGVAGSGAPLSILAGAVLHEADNSFTAEARGVLRFGASLDLGYVTARK